MPYVIMDYRLFITLLALIILSRDIPFPDMHAQIDMYILNLSALYMHFLIPPFHTFFSSAMTPNALLNPLLYIWISFHHFSTNSLVLAPVCKGHSHNIFFCVPQYFFWLFYDLQAYDLYCSVFPGTLDLLWRAILSLYSISQLHFHCISFSLLVRYNQRVHCNRSCLQ